MTNPEEHIEDITVFYEKYKLYVLRSSTDDLWLRENQVVLYYGGTQSNIKLMVSSLYNYAVKSRDECLAKIKNLPPEAAVGRSELTYCDKIRLSLYKIFYEIEKNEKDRKRLFSLALDLETDMDSDDTVSSSDTNKSTSTANPLGGLMDVAKGFASQFGIPPEMINNFNLSEVSNTLSNPETKTTLQNAIKGITEGKDIVSVMQDVFSTLKVDPSSINQIVSSSSAPISDVREEKVEEQKGEEQKGEEVQGLIEID
jgi:hypothetical protein